MFRGNFNYPDLDILESPLLSSAPFTAVFSNIPGSAIAEKIFNDPESWGDDDEDHGDFPEDVDGEQLVWLTEELEKAMGKAPGNEPHDDLNASTPTEKGSLITTPASSLPPYLKASLKRDPSIAWKGIGKRGAVRPISLAGLFDASNEDFSGEIQQQLSKILESGGIPHHFRSYPHSSALSPPSTSGTTSTLDSPLQVQTAHTTGSRDDPSPVTIYSASATLSFLEWYGIYPDSPRMDLRRSIMQAPKSARQRAPTLHVPSPRHASRPTSLLATPMADAYVAPAAKRASSVPPPGLDIPPEQPSAPQAAPPPQRSRSPTPQPRVRSPSPTGARLQPVPSINIQPARAVSKERGRSLPHAAPPPYERTPSFQRSESTPSVRRLPSIPPETVSTSRSSTPPVNVQPPSRTATPPQAPQASRPPSRTTTPPQGPGQMGPRPPSSIRSPPCGPAGPRTRARGRDSTGTPSIASAMGHRPPVLRL